MNTFFKTTEAGDDDSNVEFHFECHRNRKAGKRRQTAAKIGKR